MDYPAKTKSHWVQEQERRSNLLLASAICTVLYLVGFYPVRHLPVAPVWWIVLGVLAVLCAYAALDMYEDEHQVGPLDGRLLLPLSYYWWLMALTGAAAAGTWLAIAFGLLV